MADYLFLIPLLPLLATAINLLFGPKFIRGNAHLISIPAIAGSFVLSALTLYDLYDSDEPLYQHLWTWVGSGTFEAPIAFYVDELAAVMITMVTFVSLLVHIYSVGYMHGDASYYRFFSWLPLFVFSMLILVLADNYLLIFAGWEGVGLCSYLLIGYYYKRRSASNAAKKAFIVNRIGDVGFGLGIMLMFVATGSVMASGSGAVPDLLVELHTSERTITAISLLLFAGAVGKSAQFPLHVWLPDAMEGPTPVSALIHAATMVTAGIYLVSRSFAIFSLSSQAMTIIALVGAFTAFMGATIALAQNDIKRVVAYSTVSQLGFMTLALGSGLWLTAIFHLITHAFFKAALFLGSGSVIHGMHEEQDIRFMGGLRKFMPITFATFLIASLANAGVVPFAGFWSKDEIIVGTWTTSFHPRLSDVLTIVALVAAFLSALYMFRLVFLVFFGKPRFDENTLHPHESPLSMTVPLVVLAVGALIGGIVGWPPDEGEFHDYLSPSFLVADTSHEEEVAALASDHGDGSAIQFAQESEETGAGEELHVAGHHEISDETKLTFAILSSILAIGGIFIAYLAFIRHSIDVAALCARFSGAYDFLRNKWYFDEVYNTYVVFPLRRLSLFLWQDVDVRIIDGAILGIANGFGWLSGHLRKLQTGLVGNYALAIALGMVAIVGVYFAAFSDLLR